MQNNNNLGVWARLVGDETDGTAAALQEVSQ